MGRSEELRLGSVPYEHVLSLANSEAMEKYYGSQMTRYAKVVRTSKPGERPLKIMQNPMHNSLAEKFYDTKSDHQSRKTFRLQKEIKATNEQKFRGPGADNDPDEGLWQN